MKLDQDLVRRVFDYDSTSGELTRAKTYCSRPSVLGRRQTTKQSKGYITVSIGSKNYLAHRIIWLHVHGYLPENFIDHINRNKVDNRIENLREISGSCNIRNSKDNSNNTSGVRGVYWGCERGGWEAKIGVSGRTVALGRFGDFTEAVAHRLAAEQCLGWESCNANTSAKDYIDSYIEKEVQDENQ